MNRALLNSRAFTVMEAVAVMVILSISGGIIWLATTGAKNASAEALAYQKMHQVAAAEQAYASTSGRYTTDTSNLTAALGDITLVTGPSLSPQAPLNTADEEKYSVAVDSATGQLTIAVHLNTGPDGAGRCLSVTVNSLLAATDPGALTTPGIVDTVDETQCDAALL